MLILLASLPALRAAAHAEPAPPTPTELTASCWDSVRLDYVGPAVLKEGKFEGRVLVEVERTTKGRLRVVRIAISNPPGKFDSSVRRIVASARCKPITAPLQGYVSVAFSPLGGFKFPHFDGVEDRIDIEWGRVR